MKIKILNKERTVFDVYYKIQSMKISDTEYIIIGTNFNNKDVELERFNNIKSTKEAMLFIVEEYANNPNCVLIL